jgi:hypothetical protein
MGDVDRRGRIRWKARLALVEQILQRSDHQRQRRPELVRDIREECRLRAIELRQRLDATSLGFERFARRELRSNLRGDESEERAVVLIEFTHRIHRRDDDRARMFCPGSRPGAPAAWCGGPFHAPSAHGSNREDRSAEHANLT